MSAPYYASESVTIWHGDCLDVLAGMAAESVDSVVTDPPYGLGFMGKEWDSTFAPADMPMRRSGAQDAVNAGAARQGGRQRAGADYQRRMAKDSRAFGEWCQLWAAECLRVLQPGGHLLAFGGTRTWHRLVCAVEDAGFEIRDSIAWIYGQGFSKGGLLRNREGIAWCECGENALPFSHAGNPDLPRVRQDIHAASVTRCEGAGGVLLAGVQRAGTGPGMGEARAQGARGMVARSGRVRGGEDERGPEPVVEGRELHRAQEGLPDDPPAGASEGQGERLRSRAPAGDGVDDRPASDTARGGTPHQRGPGGQPPGEPAPLPGPHDPLDDGALRGRAACPRCGGLSPAFRGFSTTLKPAFEPVVVARKPLAGTVAANVLRYGTGAINVDGCRVGFASDADERESKDKNRHADFGTEPGGNNVYGDYTMVASRNYTAPGRWPPNVALDDTAAAELDEQSGEASYNPAGVFGRQKGNANDGASVPYSARKDGDGIFGYGDRGGASRFFPVFRYEAKAPTSERPRSNGIGHPTTKPLDLIRWLVRLVTPPGGLVLDPFAGSGTTAEAAILEGFRAVVVEREAEYLPHITQRIHRRRDPVAYLEAVGEDLGLFGELP